MGVDKWLDCGKCSMIKVENIKLKVGFNENDVKQAIAKSLRIQANDVKGYEFLRLSIDARKKPTVYYVATIGASLTSRLEETHKGKAITIDRSPKKYEQIKSSSRPVVVGFGPSGMFSALMLARMGLKPIVIEQGKCVDDREKDVQEFWLKGKLNTYSNVQFGEGGAGTFSDGKLNSTAHSGYVGDVLNEFYVHGAPKEILYLSKPHIGSDNLKTVVKNIRNEIISLGGEIKFNTKLINIDVKNNNVCGIKLLDIVKNSEFDLSCDRLILAVGHSARDTFSLLKIMGVTLEKKPFAMGVRIEQKQTDINIAQYGENYDKRLPSADYKLVEHLDNGRSVFTFCMCPGGVVVSSTSDEGSIVTNGMSYFARDKENANSAVLVNVMPSDFGGDDVLAGVEMQKKYERLAFELGGRNYNAPAETVGEFLGKGKTFPLKTSYLPNITFCDITKCLPKFVTDAIKEALPKFDKRLKGFADDKNLLIAIESRSSSPVTIVRDEQFQASVKGLYPIGEGAGYAGGIMTSAIDGIKCAEKIYLSLK